MSSKGSGRSPRRYGIHRIRLVNFHNLVDETIEIREGGHLFLLGDNGSGKTTVLDAIHLVLSGGESVELNAAARVGGRAGDGRSLAGIVLRLDAERGVINEGGAITYALLELGDAEGNRLTLGVGLEATTLDARVTRWGVLHAGPLEEVPILIAGADGVLRTTPRDVLRDRLPKHETFGRMTDYRRAVADRLFGGAASYEDVCRFWSMAKAYREIVTQARDFDALFARLLPAPDSEVFREILGSLRAIDELETALGEIEQQRSYVAALDALRAQVARHREEVARYRWLAVDERLRGERQAAAVLVRELEDAEIRRRRAAAEVEDAEGGAAAVRRRLREAESTEGAELGRALAGATEEVASRRGELAPEREARSAQWQRAERARRDAEDSAARLGGQLREAAAMLEAALGRIAGAPRAFRACRAAVEATVAWSEAVEGAPAGLFELRDDMVGNVSDSAWIAGGSVSPSASEEMREALARARGAEEGRGVERARWEGRAAEASARLRALEEDGDLEPAVVGFAEGRAALVRAGISASAVYELMEPRAGAAVHEIAALESMLGEEVLATFVVAEEDIARARAVLASEAPGARVVVRAVDGAAVPHWIGALLVPARGVNAEWAHAAVAAALVQPPSLGAVGAPDAVGVVEIRGAAFRPAFGEPRLLGAESRRRERARRIAEAQRVAERAQAEAEEAGRRAQAAARHAERCREAAAALDGLRSAEVREEQVRLELRAQRAREERRRLEEADARVAVLERRLREAEDALALLRARADAVGLDELERRMAALRAQGEEAERRVGAALRGEAAASANLEVLRAQRARVDERLAALTAERSIAAGGLRAQLEEEAVDDAALERYVRVTRGGAQFKSVEAIEERQREAERHEQEACIELEGDGSRGVRNLTWAGRFGFAYDRADNRVEDRRGQPLGNVLSQIDRELAEQRTVVNERTRELMDTLVMGALARKLQDQVEGLRRMLRDINRLLEDLRFGPTRYRFKVTPRADRRELEELVRLVSLVDEASRQRFREWIDGRLEELSLSADDETPELLDYRRWYDYRLLMRTRGEGEGVELSREKRQLGSGGEQGVPNYLLVLALAKLMFDNAGARVRPLLFDEAFYGIDAGRRDQLLRFATELGLQLVVASPDQDGATPAVRSATTLFLVRDEHADVHLAPYHYWNRTGEGQRGLFDEMPEEAPAEEAECVVGGDRLPEGGDEIGMYQGVRERWGDGVK